MCARGKEAGKGPGAGFVRICPPRPAPRDFWNGRSWLSRGVCGRVGFETTYHKTVLPLPRAMQEDFDCDPFISLVSPGWSFISAVLALTFGTEKFC